MATVTKYLLQASPVTLLSTELGNTATPPGLGASTYALSSSSFDNEAGTANMDGYTEGEIEIVLAAPSGAFAANSALYLWWIKSIDGTNYEDSCGPLTNQQGALISSQVPDYQWTLPATNAGCRIVRRVHVPPGNFKVMIGNIQGSGTQAFANTGNTIKLRLDTTQGV